ncbi:MAG: hypothetical protein HN627_08770 [Opitutae bacterium]|nr:hypothetical protein [Opitutae bacterium]
MIQAWEVGQGSAVALWRAVLMVLEAAGQAEDGHWPRTSLPAFMYNIAA